MTFLRQRVDDDRPFECPQPITCQFPGCECSADDAEEEPEAPMNAALMNQLRESLLLERARKLYTIVTVAPEDEAINIIRLALRVERDEGIAAGHDQAARFSHLEKAS